MRMRERISNLFGKFLLTLFLVHDIRELLIGVSESRQVTLAQNMYIEAHRL